MDDSSAPVMLKVVAFDLAATSNRPGYVAQTGSDKELCVSLV